MRVLMTATRQRRELDQASTEKFLAEKAIEEEKKKKMNAQAKVKSLSWWNVVYL